MKVRIESDGHIVEVEGTALDYKLPEVVEMAEAVWNRTRPPVDPKQQVGFGGLLVERSHDSQPAGSPYCQPVTATHTVE